MRDGDASAGKGPQGPAEKGRRPEAGASGEGRPAEAPREEERGEIVVIDEGAPPGSQAKGQTSQGQGKPRGTIILHRGGMKKAGGGGEKPADGAAEGAPGQPPPRPDGDTGPKEK